MNKRIWAPMLALLMILSATAAHSANAADDPTTIVRETTDKVLDRVRADKEALEAFQFACRSEGIIPALEPSHALAHVMKLAPTLPKDHILVMNMCGRGDKDIFTVARHLGFDMSGPEGRVFE